MLEYAIRPNQTPNALGKIIIPSTPGSARTRATLTWGSTATMPTPTATGGGFQCGNEQLQEVTRDTETVRITQPGKPENFVDVARAKNVKLIKQTGNDCAPEWNQMSGVAAEISSIMGDLANDIAAATDLGIGDNQKSKVSWKLNNNTTPP